MTATLRSRHVPPRARWVKLVARQISTNRKYREQVDPYIRNYYESLGIPQSATQPEIRQAYLSLTKQHHPDVPSSNASHDQFMGIKLAYEVLKDAKRRRAYDAHLHSVNATRPQSNSAHQSAYADFWDFERPVTGNIFHHSDFGSVGSEHWRMIYRDIMQDHDSARREEFRAVREAHFSTHERMNIENWKRYANEMGQQPEKMSHEQATAPMQRPRALRVRVAVGMAGVALVCIAYILVKSKSSPDRGKKFVHGDQSRRQPALARELEPPKAIMPRTH